MFKKITLVLVVSLYVVVPNATAQLIGGEVAYWPFNGDATDATGNGHDGTASGPVAYSAGVLGRALDLRGGAAWIDVATPILNGEQECSVALWLSVEDFAGGLEAIYAENNWPPSGLHINLIPTSSQIEWVINSNAEHINSSIFEPAPTPFVQYTFTYSSLTAQAVVYRNGIPISTRSYSAPVPCGSGVASRIGAWLDGVSDVRFLDGQIDDMRIFARALSQPDAELLYELQYGPGVPGLGTAGFAVLGILLAIAGLIAIRR